MLRGNFTNEPAPGVAVDWSVLVRVSKKWGGLWTNVDFIPGARGWINRTWDYRLFGVIIGTNKHAEQIENTLLTALAEVRYSPNVAEFKTWLRRNPQVVCFYTNNKLLFSLDDVIRPFSGWNEGVDGLRSGIDIQDNSRRKVKRGDGFQSPR